MSVQKIPALRIADARYRLVGQRGHDAATLDEFALDSMLTKVAELLRPGTPAPTKTSVAQAVEDAARIARERLNAREVCWCGHLWADHVGRGGCFECDVCLERRPIKAAAASEPMGTSSLRIMRCVHDGCVQTGVRSLGVPFACETHKTSEGR